MLTQPRKARRPLAVVTNMETSEKTVHSSKRIIKFIGNMSENVELVLSQINCSCGCTEFREILHIFGDKIEKLRAERDACRDRYFQDVEQLRNEIKKMEADIINVFKDESSRNLYPISHIKSESSKALSRQNESSKALNSPYLLKKPEKCSQESEDDDDRNLEKGEDRKFKKDDDKNLKKDDRNLDKIYNSEGVERLMKKYNVELDELEELMQEYLSEQQAYFDSEEQKKLYKLSRKLEKKMWMKKVKNDLEALESARNKI